jgi:hypothetical protein
MTSKTAMMAAAALLAGGNWKAAQGQVSPATVLTIDTENCVIYQQDVSDVSQFATKPGVTPTAAFRNFQTEYLLGDIVAVNGQSAKGLFTGRGKDILTSPTPDRSVGGATADTTKNSIREKMFEILKSDGTLVGTIVALGLSGGPPAPGSPAAQTNGGWAIVGGTGAFLGARGMVGTGVTTVPFRDASITEDPGNRRINGGGKIRWIVTIFPMSAPSIATTAAGPAVAHSNDFSLVTPSKPAAAGEILSLFMTGLGPTKPGVDPGQPFPSSPSAAVNSPVQVTVNGKPADLVGAVGYPGAVDGYQVNFRVPPDTLKGPASIQVSSAWILGAPVSIPVQ